MNNFIIQPKNRVSKWSELPPVLKYYLPMLSLVMLLLGIICSVPILKSVSILVLYITCAINYCHYKTVYRNEMLKKSAVYGVICLFIILIIFLFINK